MRTDEEIYCCGKWRPFSRGSGDGAGWAKSSPLTRSDLPAKTFGKLETRSDEPFGALGPALQFSDYRRDFDHGERKCQSGCERRLPGPRIGDEVGHLSGAAED